MGGSSGGGASTASRSRERVRFFRAVTPITGTPSRLESRDRSNPIPLRRASSIRFTQTTARGVISNICSTSTRFRSNVVASQTTTAFSGPSAQRKCLATCSSGEWDSREYVPGRSARIRPPQLPWATATVFPGQLPVCWRMPVRALNRVLLPTLGFPARAITPEAGRVSRSNAPKPTELLVNPMAFPPSGPAPPRCPGGAAR